jgi:3-hydroxyacyl-CoA dehydrogenase
MFVFRAAVVGAGTIGAEIAQAIANADIPVVLKDVDQRSVDRGVEHARTLRQGQVDAGKLQSAELERKLAIAGTTDFGPFGDVDFAIEAVSVFASEDAREGISAFLQKRVPRFGEK